MDMTSYDNRYELVNIDGKPCYYIWCFSSKGKTTGRIIIDEQDFSMCQQYRWHIEKYKNRSMQYGAAMNNGKVLRIHRYIMQAPTQMQVDHINHDGLDNRRCNLRICSNRDNNCNKDFTKSVNASKLSTGIRKIKGRYYARIMVYKKEIALGGYATLEEAQAARAQAERKYFGEFKYNEVCRDSNSVSRSSR